MPDEEDKVPPSTPASQAQTMHDLAKRGPLRSPVPLPPPEPAIAAAPVPEPEATSAPEPEDAPSAEDTPGESPPEDDAEPSQVAQRPRRRTGRLVLQVVVAIGLAMWGWAAWPNLRDALDRTLPGLLAGDGNRGRLTIDSSPPAKVFLGARDLGTTPLTEVPVPTGQVELRLTNDEQGLEQVVTADVSPGKTTVLHQSYRQGAVELTGEPGHSYHVYRNGRLVGHVPGPTIQLFEGHHRLTLVDDATGVRLSRDVVAAP